MLKRLSTMICQVEDMDASVAFYRDVLGLTPSMVSQWWTTFPLGDVQIGLHPPFAGEVKAPAGGWVLGVEVEDLAALRQTLESAGVACAPYHDIPTGCIMDFTDPDGYPIQAMQAGVKAAELA